MPKYNKGKYGDGWLYGIVRIIVKLALSVAKAGSLILKLPRVSVISVAHSKSSDLSLSLGKALDVRVNISQPSMIALSIQGGGK